ncbi:nitrogenase vanadium-iron protein beta chain [Methanobrevibacter cuticularis]|uniref:Nitrogenase vanadium-iron protein beta chain n=1 Tax=Methanobrevibacter cuticularis TaxID=47311 RepID=A0A166DFR2_9EURY|nr:nitrogenase component 1 [Methanobrevibacter cuticularis]KZX15554.1 nitrogenase vanadium-iron protein beta chain [Methanobrevibacter cuticularis]
MTFVDNITEDTCANCGNVNVMKRERSLIINPLKTCQPLGAMYAILGVEKGIPLVHGSQGCSTFVRYHLARHFREPIEIAVTSLHESAAVFGGRKNINSGIKNIALRYRPELIGAITTCSSEIIGDDVFGFVDTTKRELKEMAEEEQYKGIDNVKVVPIPTPSFVGTHFTGYNVAVNSLIQNVTEPSDEKNGKINLIPGIINPGDTKELKHIMHLLGAEATYLTDISDAFDAPLRPSTESTPFFQKGGVTVDEIKDVSKAEGTITICKYAKSGAETLETTHKVPAIIESPPIGLQNTDKFLRNIQLLTDVEIPESLLNERGLLVDLIADIAARYLFDKNVAIVGDPDLVTGMARLVGELGMNPTVVCTGSDDVTFSEDMKKIAKEVGTDIDVLLDQDLRAFELYVKDNEIDIMLGNSDLRFINYETKIPLVRFGYPTYDRVGYHSNPIMGYRGAKRLTEMITNAVLEKYYDPYHWKLQQ